MWSPAVRVTPVLCDLPSDFDEVIKTIQLIKMSNMNRNYKKGEAIIKLISSPKELMLLRKKSSVCVYYGDVVDVGCSYCVHIKCLCRLCSLDPLSNSQLAVCFWAEFIDFFFAFLVQIFRDPTCAIRKVVLMPLQW